MPRPQPQMLRRLMPPLTPSAREDDPSTATYYDDPYDEYEYEYEEPQSEEITVSDAKPEPAQASPPPPPVD